MVQIGKGRKEGPEAAKSKNGDWRVEERKHEWKIGRRARLAGLSRFGKERGPLVLEPLAWRGRSALAGGTLDLPLLRARLARLADQE
ncbi:hypothetical protein KM043_000520 [Ampulex compressa]|nr:hypothetical protein KM043_000520 [Ampulex compressa]